MPEVSIDGRKYNIPKSLVNGKILRDTGKIEDEKIMYGFTSDGKHKTLSNDDVIEVKDGDSFGAISRFKQGEK